MDTSIAISIDLRRKKKDGTYPLVLRLGHKQSTTTIPLKVSVLEKDWDANNRIVRKGHKGAESVTRLNNILAKRKAEAMDVIMKLQEAGQLYAMTIAELREKVDVEPNQSTSFLTYADTLIANLREAKRFGTATSYRDSIRVLKGFVGDKDLSFSTITFDFLKRFEAYHLGKEGNGMNGLAVYMRSIRAIYNHAIKAGLAEKELYPFDTYKIRTVPTKKRALDIELLKKIVNLDFAADHKLFDARNYFVASYMLYGMNFKDMAFLKKEDIIDGRVNYRRDKTSKLYDIKITPALDGIIKHYLATNEETDFIFPILKREGLELQTKTVKWARKRYNAKLKLIAKECHIEANLTSYVSRHSFATQAMLQTVPVAAISAMLGHSSIKTTEVYLKSLPTNVLDDYNSRLLQGI